MKEMGRALTLASSIGRQSGILDDSRQKLLIDGAIRRLTLLVVWKRVKAAARFESMVGYET